MKLKSQTEILHFHPQWELRKSIFKAGKEPAWPCQPGHSLFRLEGSLRLAASKRGREEAQNLLAFSGNLTNKCSPWFKDGELLSFSMQSDFLPSFFKWLKVVLKKFYFLQGAEISTKSWLQNVSVFGGSGGWLTLVNRDELWPKLSFHWESNLAVGWSLFAILWLLVLMGALGHFWCLALMLLSLGKRPPSTATTHPTPGYLYLWV